MGGPPAVVSSEVNSDSQVPWGFGHQPEESVPPPRAGSVEEALDTLLRTDPELAVVALAAVVWRLRESTRALTAKSDIPKASIIRNITVPVTDGRLSVQIGYTASNTILNRRRSTKLS